MKSVSDEYKTDVDKDFRNNSYCEIEVDFIENVTTLDEITSVRDQLEYSTTELTDHSPRQYLSYATLENNRIKLDGSTSVYHPTLFDFNTGFISDNTTDDNGEFEPGTEPLIDIAFTEPTSFYGLTIWSDLHTEDRISDFRLEVINSASEVERLSVNGNEDVACVIEYPFQDITSIRIIIDKTNKPNMRARIGYIDFGVIKIYNNDSLMEDGAKFTDRVDPLSRELSEQSVEFTIENYNHEYDIDKPRGIHQLLKNNLPVRAKLGYKLDSGIIEWVKMGAFFLSEWNVDTYKVTFKAVGLLNTMSDNYYSTFYTNNTTIPTFTINDLINDIFDINAEEYFTAIDNVENVIQNTNITALIDILPRNQVVQYIANLCGFVLYSTFGGSEQEQASVNGKNYNNKVDYLLNKDKYFEDTLNIELEENLKAVEVKYYKYAVDDSQQDVFVGDIEVSSETNNVKIYFDKAYGKVTYSSTVKSGNPTITNVDIRSSFGYFEFSGDGVITITIKGYAINKSESVYTLNVADTGEVATIENPLITNIQLAKNVANKVANYLTKRNKYTLDYIGEPMLQTTDTVDFENQFTDGLNLVITNNEITFNGGLSGKIEGKVI